MAFGVRLPPAQTTALKGQRMQTFLPYSDFARCARVLDDKRLRNQVKECDQIREACVNPEGPWGQHPIVRMWRGHEDWLDFYKACCLCEGSRRREEWCTDAKPPLTSPPIWLGDPRLHISHRANLVRKDPDHYSEYWGGGRGGPV